MIINNKIYNLILFFLFNFLFHLHKQLTKSIKTPPHTHPPKITKQNTIKPVTLTYIY